MRSLYKEQINPFMKCLLREDTVGMFERSTFFDAADCSEESVVDLVRSAVFDALDDGVTVDDFQAAFDQVVYRYKKGPGAMAFTILSFAALFLQQAVDEQANRIF